jgi:thymidylate kinase
MIIELFGPPGVGKTTFAWALTDFLRTRGLAVDPVLSSRPREATPAGGSEASGASHPVAAVARRLTRPVAEMLTMARHMLANPAEMDTARHLMRLLPPRSLMWSIRLRQYLLRLLCSWNRAARSGDVVLFDQAFVQALCSLVLLGRGVDRTRVAQALDRVPVPDLLIRLDADEAVLETRLSDRQRHQGRIEHLFELDMKANLASVAIVDELHEMLLLRGRPVISASSADRERLSDAVARVGEKVMAHFAAGRGVEA